jgi:Zn-dependent protease
VGETYPHLVAQAGVQVNIWLMAFNLLPIPPMDGGRVVFSLLPHKAAYKFAKLEPYGLIILLLLIMTHMVGYWLAIVGTLADLLLSLIVYPLTLLLS